jgi:ZIP family zinc transporter
MFMHFGASMPGDALSLTLFPIGAVILGAIVAAWRQPGPQLVSAIQHFAAGVVFAALASELLPNLIHERSVIGTLVGGVLGVIAMLSLKSVAEKAKGPIGLVTAIGVDVLIDGVVLGIAFASGERAGLLLTIALTIELLFLALPLTAALQATAATKLRIILSACALALVLPIGVLIGLPAATLSGDWLAGLFAFGIMALLYLVTEELLVEAHEVPDRPWITGMFFAGFLILILIEELAPVAR